MKFNDYLQFRTFIRKAKRETDNKDIKLKLDKCTDNTVPDELYYLFDYSRDSYLQEMQTKSNSKTYFKTLMNTEKLDIYHAKAVTSMMTHLMIALSDRVKNTNPDKQISAAYDIQKDLQGILTNILDGQQVENKIKSWFNG